MIIHAKHTGGYLDISSQETYETEKEHFRLCLRPGQTIKIPNKWRRLKNIQGAINCNLLEVISYDDTYNEEVTQEQLRNLIYSSSSSVSSSSVSSSSSLSTLSSCSSSSSSTWIRSSSSSSMSSISLSSISSSSTEIRSSSSSSSSTISSVSSSSSIVFRTYLKDENGLVLFDTTNLPLIVNE